MSYLPATLVSVIAHGLLIFLIIKGWSYTHPPEPPKPPTYIKATLLDMKAQGKQGAPKPKPKPKPKPEPKAAEPDTKKIEIEKQRRKDEIAKQKKIALEKAKKEKAKKERAEKLKQEKLKKEREKKLAEERRKKREQQEQQKLKDDLAKEQERLEAELQAEALAQQAEDDKQLSQSYASMIRKRVEQSWSRPPSARNGMKTELSIQLVPTGEVIDVSIIKGSGNAAFDRSAVQAVKRVRQFDELKTMPSRIFEREYRKFTLIFEPQDLRQ